MKLTQNLSVRVCDVEKENSTIIICNINKSTNYLSFCTTRGNKFWKRCIGTRTYFPNYYFVYIYSFKPH